MYPLSFSWRIFQNSWTIELLFSILSSFSILFLSCYSFASSSFIFLPLSMLLTLWRVFCSLGFVYRCPPSSSLLSYLLILFLMLSSLFLKIEIHLIYVKCTLFLLIMFYDNFLKLRPLFCHYFIIIFPIFFGEACFVYGSFSAFAFDNISHGVFIS